MSAMQRRNGARIEIEIVGLHRDIGIHAEPVPLSGAARFRGDYHDVDVLAFGRDDAPVCCEVKARGGGAGFPVLERWLSDNDALVPAARPSRASGRGPLADLGSFARKDAAMSIRNRLADKREHHVLEFQFRGATYRAGFSFFANGALAEIFLSTRKPNSQADIQANDSAILCSIALQHSVPLQTIRHGLLQSDNGTAAGPLACALDLIDAGAYAR